jgi:hypothetical protein
MQIRAGKGSFISRVSEAEYQERTMRLSRNQVTDFHREAPVGEAIIR